MPYIKKEDRSNISSGIKVPETPGELNFLITDTIDSYLEDKGLSYATLNEVIGILECAKLEIYRRIIAPYEDKKKEENGDCYSSDLITE